MADQIREADYILVIASPAYRQRAQGQSGQQAGRGVQWEARLIRDAFYNDPLGVNRFMPVVVPGQTIDGVPDFLAPATTTIYHVDSFTLSGAEALLRVLLDQPIDIEPPLGQQPPLPSRPAEPVEHLATGIGGLVSVEEWNPFALGVHRSITVDGARIGGPAALTPYVPRRHDAQLRRLLNERPSALMAVLVGESSTGKTRGMFEAVRACVPDWPLAHPLDAEALLKLVETLRPPVVLWLNETQRYFDGPAGPAVAQALHRLLSMPPGPVIVLGSMWLRQHWERLTHMPAAGTPDPHLHARELLRGIAYRIDVPPTLDDPAAQHALDAHARRDRRLALARETANTGRIIQVLAGGVELANRYNHPTDPYGHAVLTAAIDARRLGFQALLPAEFLRQAAPGYLEGHDRSTPAAQSGRWFADALAIAQHPILGVAALTSDRRQDGIGESEGFQLHDYLDQHGRFLRRAIHIPAATWDGLIAHTTDAGDLVRLIEQAADRALFRYAYELYTEAQAQDVAPPRKFQNYLTRIGVLPEEKWTPFQSAIEELQLANAQRSDAAGRSDLKLSTSTMDLDRLVRWLEDEGRKAEIEAALRFAVVRDIPQAHERLVEWLTRAGRHADVETAWREVFTADRHKWERLVGWLHATGKPDEAEEVLREAVALGVNSALYRLINLLHATGRDDKIEQVLRDAIDAGEIQAAGKLADLLIASGRLAEAEQALRHSVLIGHSSAISHLVVLLSRTDRQAEADQLWRFGLTVDGDTSPAW
jgi:tetratricopeptide (TPR) repeat protein